MNMVHEDTLFSQFIAFILIFLIRKPFAAYVISNEAERWGNAVYNCTLATPPITINGSLVYTSYISNDSDVWVGYYKRTTAFEYIGCTSKVDFAIAGKPLDTHVSKPSQCFPGCANNGIFAVTFDEKQADSFDCYCLSSLPMNSSNDGCTSKCPGMLGVPCGGKDKASIYRLAPYINASEIENGDYCLSIQYDDDKVKNSWKSCHRQLMEVLCEHDNRAISRPCQPECNWTKAMNYCFNFSLRPSSYNASTRKPESDNEDNYLWTGVLKDELIYRYDQWRRGFTGIQYGYIKARSSELEFSYDGSKRWLCENERTTSTRASTAKTNTQPTDNPQGSSAASTVGIPVAVSASVLVLILVIVFIIIFKKRMLKKTLEDKSHVIGNNEPVACSYSYVQGQRTSENPTDGFHAQNTTNGDHNEYMYAEFDNTSLTTYDVTCKGGKRTDNNIGQIGNDNANVYNKLGAEEKEQTYDKTVVGKATGNTNYNVLSSDKTYDSNVSTEYAFTNTGSELAPKETSVDNIYDKSKQCDNIYNSVNENPTVNKTTDNVYGIK